ncbi:hypothetical protein [Promicromonospora sp. NPDC023805]|uniref:hypothetical protein n=1 Tax=Promicromonospora sp. NPDC023805 TaxID=3154696 RepID=UPI003409DD1D
MRPIVVGDQKPGVVAHLTPGVPGQEFGVGEDISSFVLTTRFEGADIRKLEEFPCFVFIALPQVTLTPEMDRIAAVDLQVIAWGELYRTATDAEQHRFG